MEISREDLEAMMERNNQERLPTGDYTGRCKYCGSRDLWDDNLNYGCNRCGAVLRPDMGPPKERRRA